ncbi:MAG: hypothetical protein RIQ94_384 [Pseudomonadota bacterium]|jgi:hypothetical protein
MGHINELAVLNRSVISTDSLIIEAIEGTRRIAATEFKGESGTNGGDGEQGVKGDQGVQGEQGLTGATGSDTRAREVVIFTTLPILTNCIEVGTCSIEKTFELLQVVLSSPGRLRLYSTIDAQMADMLRPVTVIANAGIGLIVEVNNPANNQQNLDPHALGSNMDEPFTDKIYYSLTNNGSTIEITVGLTFLRKES